MANNISVTILTKDSAAFLAECLGALEAFTEVVVVDNGSTDDTIAIASRFRNVRLFEHPFTGFGPMKNIAVDKAANDWIFSVDSDEIVTPELTAEILNLKLDSSRIYAVGRDNHYRRRLICGCGWQNDQVQRLFNRKRTRYDDKLVHEGLKMDDQLQTELLEGRLNHYPYDNASQLIQKMQHYSTLWAEESLGRKKASPFKALFYGVLTFFKSYLFKKGWLYGYEGLLISISNANGVFYKYIKLYEADRSHSL
ncbi:glycosyltransferase family 2 protein [Chlorobium sp. BLA1]|uniref:glycosyltransferase family 2 protein n=1 Tax=Candidatus Chlorobium masyuteum TaxID=2716876 RepID=UPI0014210436|nr:glycosyltransferase family 2 protein [Candidatus Chlorobium masyuteum]NHQ59889.1 glycosyltransferase family 2 protein [Candidatus Chlorobium masyuteum]